MIEQLREVACIWVGLRVSQYLSLALCALAAGVLLWRASRGDKRWFAVAVGCLAAWLARWACLERLVCTPCCRRGAGGCAVASAAQGRACVALCAAAALDALGVLAAWLGAPFSAGFAACLHALLCSVSLPGYVAALALDGIPMRHK